MSFMVTHATLATTLTCTLALAPPVALDGAPQAPDGQATTQESDGVEAAVEPTPEPPPPQVDMSTADATPLLPQGAPSNPCRPGERDICRDKRIAGATLTGFGIAGMGLGFGFALAPPQTLSGQPMRELRLQPVGIALIGGAVMVITTGVFLLVDAVQTKRGGPRARARRRAR